MPKEFIVAIELGSSKIAGIAGQRNLDGSINVLAMVKEDTTSCVKRGVVYNIDKTVQCLNSVITKLQNTLQTRIDRVFVGAGGMSLRSVRNNINKEFQPETIVTQDIVNELSDTNRTMSYPNQEILDAVVQEYKVDSQFQTDPVGIQCKKLEGNFLNILWRENYYNNLRKCFDNAGIAIADIFISPMALADSVLTDSEKRLGCALIDMGAETTTVAVYSKNMLRHLSVVPLGGSNITKDIASLQIEDKEAESIKLKYASAYTDLQDIDENRTISTSSIGSLKAATLINYVEARQQEIIVNALNQIPEEFRDKLNGGIILTGGASKIKNIERAFREHKVDKIRTAKFVQQTVHSSNADINAHDGSYNTLLSLLAKGNMNCAGQKISNNLFGDDAGQTPNSVSFQVDGRSGKSAPAEDGKVQNGNAAAVKPKAPANDKKPEKNSDVNKGNDNEPNKQKEGMFSKMGHKLKDFLTGITAEE